LTATDQEPSDAAIAAVLRRIGALPANATPRITQLTGGVSSDIRLVEWDAGRLCVKRALPRLRVAQLWEAPVERNGFEWAWFETVATICPEAVPRLIAAAPDAGLFAMEYLEPAQHPVWKAQLRDGIVDDAIAAAVGERLARIHAATADRADVAARFATDAGFYAIRLEPYLVATARVHADLAAVLTDIVSVTAGTRRTLVHGDVSPKNILVGSHGPILIDAECAWFGDPAFDLAFCLNHLLLKCLWTPTAAPRFLTAFATMTARYLSGVTWEPPAALEARAARLLPGLLLARVDGKSPAEYVTEDRDKDRVRRAARDLLLRPRATLGAVRQRWQEEIGA
jgi:aminoglycoside phosphotransferase (APT) family kinase protein